MQLIFYISVFNILMVKVKKKEIRFNNRPKLREKRSRGKETNPEESGTKSTDTILPRPWESYKCPGRVNSAVMVRGQNSQVSAQGHQF